MTHKRDFREASDRNNLCHHMQYPTGSQFLDHFNVTYSTDEFNAVERRFLRKLGETVGWDKAGFIHRFWQVTVWLSEHTHKHSLIRGNIRIKQLNTIKAKLEDIQHMDYCLANGMWISHVVSFDTHRHRSPH